MFTITGTQIVLCPHCGGELKSYDRRFRNYINNVGDQILLYLRRLKCQSCRKMHTELPDYLVPYKRYCVEVIEEVATTGRSRIPEDTCTRQKIKQWYRSILPQLKAIWQRLTKQHLVSPFVSPSLRNMVKATVNSGFWIYHPFGNSGRGKNVISSS